MNKFEIETFIARDPEGETFIARDPEGETQ